MAVVLERVTIASPREVETDVGRDEHDDDRKAVVNQRELWPGDDPLKGSKIHRRLKGSRKSSRYRWTMKSRGQQ